jgi:hypothetical protein
VPTEPPRNRRFCCIAASSVAIWGEGTRVPGRLAELANQRGSGAREWWEWGAVIADQAAANIYGHVMLELSKDATERVGNLLWAGV